MADTDKSINNLRYNQVTQGLEGFGGGSPMWTPLIVGGGSSGTFATREVPSGAINGSNVTFTLAHTPISGSESVFRNGILQTSSGDYTIAGAVITYGVAPLTGDKLVVSYRY